MEKQILEFKKEIENINQEIDNLDNPHKNKKLYNMIWKAKHKYINLRSANTALQILELMVQLKHKDYSKFWDLSFILNLYLKDSFNFTI